MRLGYILSYMACELSTYESYQSCPYRSGETKSLVSFYETFVKTREDLTFVPYEIVTSDVTLNSSVNITLIGALARGAIDANVISMVITPNRFETLSFTTPHAFDRICFYIKRPEAKRVTDHPLFFLSPFSIHTWLLLALTLIVMQSSSYFFINHLHLNNFFALKLMKCVLLMAEGLILISYLAALREVLIETGSIKSPFRNRYENGFLSY